MLSWLHPKNSASITRASQPNAGLVGKTRNKDDERYFQVKDVSSLVNTSNRIFFFFKSQDTTRDVIFY